MAISKTGVSIAEMQRELEIKDYKTIWVMAHKIRKGMSDRDAHYRLARSGRGGRIFLGWHFRASGDEGPKVKPCLIHGSSTWVDRSGKEKPGFAHAFVANDATANTIEGLLRRPERSGR